MVVVLNRLLQLHGPSARFSPSAHFAADPSTAKIAPAFCQTRAAGRQAGGRRDALWTLARRGRKKHTTRVERMSGRAITSCSMVGRRRGWLQSEAMWKEGLSFSSVREASMYLEKEHRQRQSTIQVVWCELSFFLLTFNTLIPHEILLLVRIVD